jgi:acetolactate synthase-1/2/3 large subunit
MNGAESLLRTLVGSGVEVCFGNPGTSEMHFVEVRDIQPNGAWPNSRARRVDGI